MSCSGLLVVCAADSNAVLSERGSDLPRFSARFSTPWHARALKEYRRGTSPVSKMSDNEDAAAALGDSEVLSVKHSVGPPVPEFAQRPEEGTKVSSSV